MNLTASILPLFHSYLRGQNVMSEATKILSAIDQGDASQAEQLLPLVYRELRQLAASKLAEHAPGQTLQATALVHEAYLRLAAPGKGSWASQHHFFAAAAEAMRHILIDRARRKGRPKHGGDWQRLSIDELDIAAMDQDDRFLHLNEALCLLEGADPLKAQIVKLHCLSGLTHQETAQLLNLSEKTVRRHWNFARVWLYQAMRESQSG